MRLVSLALGVGCSSADPKPSESVDQASVSTCPVTLEHRSSATPDEVWLDVDMPGWRAEEHRLEQGTDGLWQVTAALEPGTYAYRFIEFSAWTEGGSEVAFCDAEATLAICSEATTWVDNWSQDCQVADEGCSSMLRVEDCSRPSLNVESVEVKDGVMSVSGTASPRSASVVALLNESPLEVTLNQGVFHVEHTGLTEGRHHLTLMAKDDKGALSDPVAVPFWTDDWTWDDAVIYHAMIDRVANGDPSNDATSGTSHTISDWAGGDFVGLHAALPYLAELGVNTLWLSNPQPAPEGAWPGSCGATYSGFHGFWPVASDGVDPRLGSIEELDELISGAHARGMRVIMDWVGNHVHSDHPQAEERGLFHPLAECNGSAPSGGSNWDSIPEDCWFTSYLPDWDHSQPEVMDAVVQTAIDWARDRKLDGLRVDAVKHMSHATVFNLRSQLAAALEHPGSNFDFNLIGETFDGEVAINRYIGPHLLHGQFDFPLYWSLRATFAHDSRSVSDSIWQAASTAETYPDGRMSTFLGNLDVSRFVSDAAEDWDGVCGDDGIREASAPTGLEPYQRLVLAWTVLFTQPGMPMIYYGDEFGLPGYGDPDNRQPLSWHGVDITQSVTQVLAGLAEGPALVLEAVSRLSRARATHPALRRGDRVEWWNGGDGLYATAHLEGEDEAIVVINRTDTEQWLDNGVAFAGLTRARWRDALTDETIQTEGDRLLFSIPPFSAQVWIGEP